jgi:hypothetical protein
MRLPPLSELIFPHPPEISCRICFFSASWEEGIATYGGKMSPKLEELKWEQLKEQLGWIVEDRSSLDNEKRERLMAKSLLVVMGRLDAMNR